MMSTFNWPPWVTAEHKPGDDTVWLTVTAGGSEYRWPVRSGEATSRETLRIAGQIRAGLIQRQASLRAITARLKR